MGTEEGSRYRAELSSAFPAASALPALSVVQVIVHGVEGQGLAQPAEIVGVEDHGGPPADSDAVLEVVVALVLAGQLDRPAGGLRVSVSEDGCTDV
jgi:hypothetical protein